MSSSYLQFLCGGSAFCGEGGGKEGETELGYHETVGKPGGGIGVAVVFGEEPGSYGGIEGSDALQLLGCGLLGNTLDALLQASEEAGVVGQLSRLGRGKEPGMGEPLPLALHVLDNLGAEAVAAGHQTILAHG